MKFASAASTYLLLCCCWNTSALSKDLTVDRATIHQIEDGPPIEPGYEFLPGETVYLSFRIGGFESKEKDDEFRTVHCKYTIEVSDPAGVPAVPKWSGETNSNVRSEDKDWVPKIRREILLPDFAERGKYKIALWVKDENSGEETRKEVTFQVRGKAVAPSEELVFRNFGFYRTENDRRALTEAVYRAGDPVLVRFDATGYTIGPKNSFSVEYGLQVSGPDGKVVIDQPQAAAEKFESFYPRRWLPVSFRLDLPKDPPKGAYTLRVQLRDTLAGKSIETQRKFTVE